MPRRFSTSQSWYSVCPTGRCHLPTRPAGTMSTVIEGSRSDGSLRESTRPSTRSKSSMSDEALTTVWTLQLFSTASHTSPLARESILLLSVQSRNRPFPGLGRARVIIRICKIAGHIGPPRRWNFVRCPSQVEERSSIAASAFATVPWVRVRIAR